MGIDILSDVRKKTDLCQEKKGFRNGNNDQDFLIFFIRPIGKALKSIHLPSVSGWQVP